MATKKLKTMNDISAARAVKLFHAAMVLDDGDPTSLYSPIPKGFPDDIAARDFLECLRLYSEMWREGEASAPNDFLFYEQQKAELLNAVAENTDVKVTPKEQQLIHALIDNPDLDREEIAEKLEIDLSTYKTHFQNLCKKYKVNSRAGLVGKVRRSEA